MVTAAARAAALSFAIRLPPARRLRCPLQSVSRSLVPVCHRFEFGKVRQREWPFVGVWDTRCVAELLDVVGKGTVASLGSDGRAALELKCRGLHQGDGRFPAMQLCILPVSHAEAIECQRRYVEATSAEVLDISGTCASCGVCVARTDDRTCALTDDVKALFRHSEVCFTGASADELTAMAEEETADKFNFHGPDGRPWDFRYRRMREGRGRDVCNARRMVFLEDEARQFALDDLVVVRVEGQEDTLPAFVSTINRDGTYGLTFEAEARCDSDVYDAYCASHRCAGGTQCPYKSQFHGFVGDDGGPRRPADVSADPLLLLASAKRIGDSFVPLSPAAAQALDWSGKDSSDLTDAWVDTGCFRCCETCRCSILKKHVLPQYAVASSQFHVVPPAVLADERSGRPAVSPDGLSVALLPRLGFVARQMIAAFRAQHAVLRLVSSSRKDKRNENNGVSQHSAAAAKSSILLARDDAGGAEQLQRAMHGHLISFRQDTNALLSAIEKEKAAFKSCSRKDVLKSMKIALVSPQHSRQQLLDCLNAHPAVAVNVQDVEQWLAFLRVFSHASLYPTGIVTETDEPLEDTGVEDLAGSVVVQGLEDGLEAVRSQARMLGSQSGYASTRNDAAGGGLTTSGVVRVDTQGIDELDMKRQVAKVLTRRMARERAAGTLAVVRGEAPVSEFRELLLFAGMHPCLFPAARGLPTDPSRRWQFGKRAYQQQVVCVWSRAPRRAVWCLAGRLAVAEL